MKKRNTVTHLINQLAKLDKLHTKTNPAAILKLQGIEEKAERIEAQLETFKIRRKQ